MKKNKEIVVWDLLRQVREITKYLSEMISSNLMDSGAKMAPHPQYSNNALIPELSDDTSSNNNSSTPVSRYKTVGPKGVGSRGSSRKGMGYKMAGTLRGSHSPHTSNSVSNKGNIRKSVESVNSVSEVSGTGGSASNTVGNTTQEIPPKKGKAILEVNAIKDLRLKEDLAELNQKYFNDKYLKFLTYNEQNTRTAETKAKNHEKDPQVLNRLFIECQMEE